MQYKSTISAWWKCGLVVAMMVALVHCEITNKSNIDNLVVSATSFEAIVILMFYSYRYLKEIIHKSEYQASDMEMTH